MGHGKARGPQTLVTEVECGHGVGTSHAMTGQSPENTRVLPISHGLSPALKEICYMTDFLYEQTCHCKPTNLTSTNYYSIKF